MTETISLHQLSAVTSRPNKFKSVEIRDLDYLKELLVAVSTGFEQAIVDKAISTSGIIDSGPV